MKKLNIFCSVLLLTTVSVSQMLWADEIIKPYQSVRSAGMGGVIMTTGLYDENFFNNPARVTANPSSKFTLLQLTPAELNPETIRSVPDVISNAKNLKSTLSSISGEYLHNRTQFVLPAFYLATNDQRDWALAFALMGSIQANWLLNSSYSANLGLIGDVGPAVTFGHKFLQDRLSLGITGHYLYRVSAAANYGLVDYIEGKSLGLNNLGGQGGMVNFDLGTTYLLAQFDKYNLNLGAAVQNALGSKFSSSPRLLHFTGTPIDQPTSFGLGMSVSRENLAFLQNTIFALEATNIGNNPNGSFYKLLHFGGETQWKVLAVRAGINQGYLCAGLGLNLRILTLDFATYGEEIGLNTGTQEDRRYTLNFGFHI